MRSASEACAVATSLQEVVIGLRGRATVLRDEAARLRYDARLLRLRPRR